VAVVPGGRYGPAWCPAFGSLPDGVALSGEALLADCEAVAAFRDVVPHGEVHEFAESAHFVQLEEAAAYADLVTRLVTTAR
jgi:pimeloyl-ACP methyl ester carboxylesterase